MSKYRVHLVAVAAATVEVEASDPEEAVDRALENAPGGPNISNDFDMGDWELASDLWADRKFEDDYEEVAPDGR